MPGFVVHLLVHGRFESSLFFFSVRLERAGSSSLVHRNPSEIKFLFLKDPQPRGDNGCAIVV